MLVRNEVTSMMASRVVTGGSGEGAEDGEEMLRMFDVMVQIGLWGGVGTEICSVMSIKKRQLGSKDS